ncbi:MAG: superoxide dismutase family protein [Nitrospira sp.]|nr:superoxide dismutase family protein [Nitrospira sp.]MDH4369725.1 superoxide dismutase family protein [Nitrospira sp.]MDH5347827.1 superoxide dismutase family protein [Nitrospira sp.]MDH5498477.1 superoxide dismutase family protein [Nitrospira sp.]MDH5725770.1 superoxide dismutase family protein [Nitrospira sp.]
MNMLSLLIPSIAALALLGGCTSYYTGKRDTKVQAHATITGEGITGEADLYEEYEGRVRITLKLEGTAASKLTPGRHAIHIHETGACDPFTAAKGHYDGNIDAQVNPEANVSPGLGNHPYHLGDLPNLKVNEDRKGSLYTITSRVTLSEGLNTLFDQNGSAFIVHELEDQYLPDPPMSDGPGGPRIACGVIVKR